ncbi:hypothetical protein YC2023_002021 [Brassica napus]
MAEDKSMDVDIVDTSLWTLCCGQCVVDNVLWMSRCVDKRDVELCGQEWSCCEVCVRAMCRWGLCGWATSSGQTKCEVDRCCGRYVLITAERGILLELILADYRKLRTDIDVFPHLDIM